MAQTLGILLLHRAPRHPRNEVIHPTGDLSHLMIQPKPRWSGGVSLRILWDVGIKQLRNQLVHCNLITRLLTRIDCTPQSTVSLLEEVDRKVQFVELTNKLTMRIISQQYAGCIANPPLVEFKKSSKIPDGCP